MENINLNERIFGLRANSETGEASTETLFYYKQEGDLVTAEYYGGSIKYGKIIAKFAYEENLEMLYQCITVEGELKAGRAEATVSLNSDNKSPIRLKLAMAKW